LILLLPATYAKWTKLNLNIQFLTTSTKSYLHLEKGTLQRFT
jgi:hypothetical protein